jgi:predicted RNA-binding protein YlxR (DUF448 family)
MAKHIPERTCILTRTAHPQGELMRFVLDPQGIVVPDLRHRLPGRGAWLTPTAAALSEAIRRRLFARAFKREAQASPGLVDEVDAALLRDLLGALALANKAGSVTTGFTKVEAALRAGQVAALLHASEAKEDGRRKLAQALRGALHNSARDPILEVPTYDDLRESDLDVALGRVHVIHAALLAGAGSEGCLARWRRLRRFRGLDDAAPRDTDERSSRNEGPDGQDRELDE